MTPEEAAFREALVERRQRAESVGGTVGQRADFAALLSRIDEALGELEAGTFGICRTCREPIERELLEADPLVCFCIDHLSRPERARLEADLDLAAQIQQRLLPGDPGTAAGWRCARVYLPAGPVGGDFLDLLADDGGLSLVLGDVAGKGIAAALLMSHLQATFRALAGVERNPARLVERINHLFCRSIPESHYATLIAARAAPDGAVELCNAGHLPALVVRPGGVEAIDATGLPAGLFCEGAYESRRVVLEPKDLLLLCTDGVTEARNEKDEEYGAARLSQLTARHAGVDAEQLVAACRDDLERFRGRTPRGDDVTLFALQRLPTG